MDRCSKKRTRNTVGINCCGGWGRNCSEVRKMESCTLDYSVRSRVDVCMCSALTPGGPLRPESLRARGRMPLHTESKSFREQMSEPHDS